MPDRPDNRPDEPTTQAERPRLTDIPPAVSNAQAARAWAKDVQSGALIKRWSRMARAARTSASLTYAQMRDAARADGLVFSENSFWRLENLQQRSEINTFLLGYVLSRGGYLMPDWYPPFGDARLTDEERQLVRSFRAAPSAERRAEMLRMVDALSRSPFHTGGNSEQVAATEADLPENVTPMPAQTRQRKRPPQSGQRRPRKMYGNGGA